MDNLACIGTLSNSAEAALLKARLESAGIPCFLKSDDAGGVLPQLTFSNGIEILVHRENVDAALTFLNEEVELEED